MASPRLNGAPPRADLMFVTYNENVLDSGILYTQVRGMLTELARRWPSGRVTLLSFISPRLWWRRRRAFRALKSELARLGIELRVRLMFAAQAWGWLALPLMALLTLPVLGWEERRVRPALIHARGYGAGWLSLAASKLLPRPLVFDPRGDYPSEMVYNCRWRPQGLSFRLWKSLEKRIISGADAVIAVTPAFRRIYREAGARCVVFIPNRAGEHCFSHHPPSPSPSSPPVLAFTGQMDSKWYVPGRVASCLKRFQDTLPELRFRILTHFDHAAVRKALAAAGVDLSRVELAATAPARVPAALDGTSAALLLGIKADVPWKGWPVKFSEFCALGLPIVAGDSVGDTLADLITRRGLGVLFAEDDPATYGVLRDLLQNRNRYLRRCRDYARRRLHISRSAAQLARLYRRLIHYA